MGFVEHRCEQLSGLLLDVKQSRQLLPGFAGRCGATWLLSDSKGRQFGPRQAKAAVRAWTCGLAYTVVERHQLVAERTAAPGTSGSAFCVLDRPRVVSYNDGEGSHAERHSIHVIQSRHLWLATSEPLPKLRNRGQDNSAVHCSQTSTSSRLKQQAQP